MLKFLRKYNKFIMVVGGSLLMVVFLLPQALQQFGGAGLGGTIATYDGGRLSRKDLRDATNEFRLLESIATRPFLGRLGIEGIDHWVLLNLEVERLGLAGGPDDGLNFLPIVADELLRLGVLGTVTPTAAYDFVQNRRTEAINSGSSPLAVDRALAKLRGVYRLRQLVSSPGRISRPESAAVASELFDTVVADVAVIEANSSPDNLPEPLSEAELQAHFEKYRDALPADNEFAIGYRRPPAVTLESIKIDLQALANLIEIDEIALETFYRRNPAVYQNNKAAARTRLERDYRNAEAAKLVADAVKAVDGAIARELAALPPDETGVYRVLPDDWASRRPSLEDLAQIARRELPEQAQAVSVHPSDGVFRAEQDFSKFPGGVATSNYGPIDAPLASKLRFPQVVLAVKELAGANSGAIQEGVMFGPLYDLFGSAYYFRILDIREASPPDSLDEVRTKVLADANRLAHYQIISDPSNLERLREVAINEGLAAAAPDATVVPDVTSSRQVLSSTPRNPTIQSVNVQEVRDALVAVAEGWSADTIATAQPAEDRTVVVAAPAPTAVVVARVTGWRPLTLEDFRSRAPFVNQQIGAELSPSLLFGEGPLSFASLRDRYDYQPVTTGEPIEDELLEEEAASDEGDGEDDDAASTDAGEG